MRPILLLVLLAATPAWAADFQSVDSIRAAALSLAGADADAEATLDPSVRVPLCPVPLQAQPTGTTTVEVSCPRETGWRLFVPVKVRRMQHVLVLARGLSAGETIGAADIVPEKRDAARIVGAAMTEPEMAIGQVARRTLPAGTLLSTTDLVAPRLVRRGDNVALVARSGGLEVRMAGRALGDAGENERVTVENLSSRRIVQGTVSQNGDVLVTR
ncbi:flagellar basal body P-ring formation chaperone FlgA [Xanthomonas rydalmerensis]|uniref:Flagella basal body P-ring formation protein FlgA n=1 Tax=Xanthomonas rydalmerensis TaxID=3046274 RepID=A0ABZ0JT12_9XANT|nr:flagellar basal body P-ring formation chaperone FlgA [Xanthomonas sp. DM-2023]WOS42968.1 flagellar basal body P-ring formation chaperone FlgA [Xanthomonas sp. DM-2023]WOS47153.1 flagellar basal body P-ring formation chaperone FlgA [Xanthomonas sp. DM-2023]WOS51332.1 flagellar basal body P-ring formation chaperone FlgA [Xanthomonas sp. DM-2023]WOS55513.1 flagellar basal body P-ring formation chaperone FlgA [Xanthomonas sp. DM-2023]WOS59696.1 flagellar basal body P-ring formation chaperone Fl